MKGDHQKGRGTQAIGIDHLVGELLDQRLARRKRLHSGVAVIDDIAVAAIGIDRQGPEVRQHAGRLAADNGSVLPTAQAVEAYHADLLGLAQWHSVHIGVVVQHIAAGILPDCSVVGAPCLDGNGAVSRCNGRVVTAMDDHGEAGRDDFAVAIADAVLEYLGELVGVGAQGLYGAVAVVYHVAVIALGIQHQAAIVTGQGLARGAVDAGRADHGADGQGIAVRVAVCRADAAAGVQANGCIVQPASLDGVDADRVDHGRVVDPGHGDHQLCLVGQPAAVVDLVGEDHLKALSG
ncbi:hypothetical protein D3C80_1125260 [compost metagenome]